MSPRIQFLPLLLASTSLLVHALPSSLLGARQNDPTSVCLRWSQQSAIVNDTIYLYGGRASSDPSQKDNTWNNDLLTLDVSKTWNIGSPTLKALPQPSGPPAVANGYLWNSFSSLYLYGGEFSDNPVTSPSPFSLWEYAIPSSSWIEHDDPKTSAGVNAEPVGDPVQRSAEGAGFAVPDLGRGWLFGGHLDGYTTAGWSQSIPRVYLKSLIEYTFPGASNTAVTDLKNNQPAGTDGAWRNITQGGLQDDSGFTERADGVLVYIPGFSQQGILLGLAGGTNVTFTQMNVIDVYDIASSTWYKQGTAGETPPIRVNPCTVVAAAADGSSFNVYMYGGQNLIPAGSQIQYDDIWILTVPSFSWIKVDTNGQSVPPARAGHTCNVQDAQMISVGGYVGQNLTCDSPGIYVFDLSTLQWKTEFTSLNGSDPANRQASQTVANAKGQLPGLPGSYGYKVPSPVQSVIGGNENGAATATSPVQAATSGPMATGKAPAYAIPTETVTAQAGSHGPNVGAIVAGVVAGVFAIVAGYFAFCAWVYRRQLKLFRNHVSMMQHQAEMDPAAAEKSRRLVASSGSDRRTDGSSHGYSSLTPQTGTSGVVSSANSSTDDLMADQEPSYLGVLLNPRRSLRVVNRD